MTRYRLIEFSELDSTNRYACGRLRELADGDVIQATVQTAGRGRMERKWISHLPGNLCVSLVLKPAHAPPAELPLANLSQLLALAVCRALEHYGVSASLKWPNDVLVNGRKIAGILAETVVSGSDFLGIILGLGVNLNLDSAALATIDQPAISLAVALDHPVDVKPFRDTLLDEFFGRYEMFLQAGFGLIRGEFLQRCHFVGQSIEVRGPAGACCGTAVDIAPDGALLLQEASGQTRQITIGEMFPATDASWS